MRGENQRGKNMKQCHKCSAVLKDEETVCPLCGTPYDPDAPMEQNITYHDHSRRDESQATFALVFGILGTTFSAIGFFVLGFLEWASLPFSVLAIVFGAMRSEDYDKAKAGFVLGIIGLVFGTIGAILVVINVRAVIGR